MRCALNKCHVINLEAETLIFTYYILQHINNITTHTIYSTFGPYYCILWHLYYIYGRSATRHRFLYFLNNSDFHMYYLLLTLWQITPS